MPDTTLHTQNQRRADTVVAQPVMTQYQALREVGWIQPIDYMIAVLVAFSWLTIVAWYVFGHPSPWNVLCCCLVAFGLTQVWVVLLLFRCSHFVLLVQASMQNLPDDAARIVMGAYSGGQQRK